MYFLENIHQGTEALKTIYKNEDIFQLKYFHLDNMRVDRNTIEFRIFLPMPNNPSEKLMKQNKNIASMGITIIVDGKLTIDKFHTDESTLRELEFFKIEIDKLDDKRYKISMDSNDQTHIYVESSSVSGGLGFGCVEDWFAQEILEKTI
ncbi:MAG: hypothetical protein ABXS91_07030 [Sulfurimonas sp.]